ncbi:MULTISPECIES: hypothetical protein [Microbulbifer]|uniref:Uncharacterized protein n=1 Tax=Microbulbifer celer TaxID=435905 RepID=A0ABW3U968_9GAMM|nr:MULTISPECIES: hypothetical protein [Microbulbifer]UFN57210.1 hypothetical protein LPW13_16830 [Microbulbifer celer]
MTSPRTSPMGAHVNISEPETRRLRHQLEIEISQLSRQLSDLKGAETEVDTALLQTYQEMIFSRRALLGRIPR